MPGWSDLNAYVDGELPPGVAAEVAAAVAADAELAARVAVLAQLKAATGDALAIDAAEVPRLRLPRRSVRPILLKERRWSAAAAGVVLAIAIGIAGWLAAPQPDAMRAWLAAVEVRHVAWLADDPHPQPIDRRAVTLADATGAVDRVPDLESAHLRPVHLAVDASGRRPGLYIGYTGINGCRLGLWIGPAPDGLAAGLTRHRGSPVDSFTWRVGGTAYAVMARDMDERRLEAVVGYLERLTRTAPEMRVAGIDDASADAPCAT